MQQLFDALHILSKDEQAHQSGFVFIENIREYDLYSDFDQILTKTQMDLLIDYFPSKLMFYHLCGIIDEKCVVDFGSPCHQTNCEKN